MAGVLVTRGRLDDAMALYEQSLALDEQLGDLRGKSATLHQMANVLDTRGRLDEATALYERSLEIEEQLGDLGGKSATLAMLGQLLVTRGRLRDGITALLASLAGLVELESPEAGKVVGMLVSARAKVGDAAFLDAWREATGSDALPEWLSAPILS
jgi:tetratricopeptide (TPR) repeat protein